MSDTDLIQRLITGDATAFRILVEKYQGMVFNTCYNLLRRYDDAEDIAQDVFVEVFESVDKFRSESKLSTWLYRISINKSLNHLRKNKWKKLFSNIDEFFNGSKHFKPDIEDVSTGDAPETIEYQERSMVLQEAINKLPQNQRIAFAMNKFDELSYQEIADVMNLSLSSVESLIHRAKMNLQKKLLNYYKSSI